MKLIVTKIAAEFNKIFGGSKRVGDALRLEGKRHYDLDVKNASTLGHKQESTLNVAHAVKADDVEKIRSVAIDGNPDVNSDGNPVYKTEQNLRVHNSQLLQDVQPINLIVDVSRRLQVGTSNTAQIITFESLMNDVPARRVQDSALLGGVLETNLEVKRARDADNADLLNDTAQSELIVKEANQSLYLKRTDGTLVSEADLFVKSTEWFRKGASTYDVTTYRDYILEHDLAKNIIPIVSSSSYTLTTNGGNKNWEELSEILKSTTTSEVYKTTHLITDDSSNPIMTGVEVKDWIIGHAEFIAKVATLTAKLADRATTFGSATTNYDIDGMKALIIASVVDVATLAKNAHLLENKTISEIITRIRNEVFVVGDNTADEASGFFGNNNVKTEVRAIKVSNADNSDTVGTYSYYNIMDNVKSAGQVASAKLLYTNPNNASAGTKSYIDITSDISTMKTQLIDGATQDEYDTLKNIETIIKANKLTDANTMTSEALTRANNDGDLATLTTEAKGSLVKAINEVDSHADTKMEKAKELYFDDIISVDTTALVSTRYYVDVTNGPVVVTLPEPSDNFDKILFHGLKGDFTNNNLTVERIDGNTDTIMNSSEPLIVETNNETFTLVFVNNDWRVL